MGRAEEESLSRTAVRYRTVEPADISRVAHLPRPGEAGGDSEDRMRRYLAGEHHPQKALPPRAMWVAEVDGAPIGYIAGHLTTRFDCHGELQWIYVVPEHRRSSVASELLHTLARWFVEQRARRVCVDVGDDAARPFYRHAGAVDLSRHWMVWDDIGVVLERATARIAASVELIKAEAWAQLYLALPADFRARMGCQVRRYGRAASLLTSGADIASGNRTIGLGFDRELTDDQLSAISQSYLAVGIPRWLVEWSPDAKPRSADELFARHGARAMTPIVTFWRSLRTDLPVVEHGALRVVEIGPEHAATFEATVAEPLGIPAPMAPAFRSTVGHDHWHFYLVLDGARPIAGALMFSHEGGAWLGLSATTPTERGRGAQTALLARRLHDAAALGCAWASADTHPDTPERPNPSYRNMRRAGMDVVYHGSKYLFEADRISDLARARTLP